MILLPPDPTEILYRTGTASLRLRVSGLRAGYDRIEVLRGVDLQLGAGQSLCLVGPNGAGKSTLLNAIFGLAEIQGGAIEVDGRPVDRNTSPANRLGKVGMAYVLQSSSVFPDLTVERNLLLGGYLMHDRAMLRRSVEDVLHRHPALLERRNEHAGALSGGERRMLEIARALMMKPRLLLIDEPSIGLEPLAVIRVFDMLRGLQADGLSILLVEQNVRQGLAFADLAYMLVDGRVVRAGTAAELLGDPAIGAMLLGGEV